MKKLLFFVLFACLLSVSSAFASEHNGLITIKSNYSVKETLSRLEHVLKEKGITIALHWSHSDRGNAVGIPLRPTELLIFGNPKLGTNMFTSNHLTPYIQYLLILF